MGRLSLFTKFTKTEVANMDSTFSMFFQVLDVTRISMTKQNHFNQIHTSRCRTSNKKQFQPTNHKHSNKFSFNSSLTLLFSSTLPARINSSLHYRNKKNK